MKQEKIELLLKDLGARVSYKVKIAAIQNKNYAIILTRELFGSLNFIYWIPYLRPMSSMTKEERKEWLSLMRKEYREQYPHSAVDTSYYEYFPTIESFDYLNSHHFDYRGLIEKGLALEAPEGMYNIKD